MTEDPDHTLARCRRFLSNGQINEALSGLNSILNGPVDSASILVEALRLAASAHGRTGRLAQALHMLDRAVELSPLDPEVDRDLEAGRSQIWTLLRQSTEAGVAMIVAYASAGQSCGLVRPVIEVLREACRLRQIDLHKQLAWCHFLLADIEPAHDLYRDLVIRDPRDAVSWSNLGRLQTDLNQPELGLKSYDRALTLNRHFPQALLGKGMTLMTMAQWTSGSLLFEQRWNQPDFLPLRPWSSAPWLNPDTPVEGRRILIDAEQGLGDSLQFTRLLKPLADSGAHLIVEVPGPLKPLFARIDWIEEVVELGAPLPEHDFHIPMASLIWLSGAEPLNLPGPTSWITPSSGGIGRWADHLTGLDGPRIGLTWSGNPAQANDGYRSTSLSAFEPLITARPDIRFFALQKQIKSDDVALASRLANLELMGDDLIDMDDTAGLIANLDLVISVCTSVAHLAGAMGKPVWILLAANCDWRWLRTGDTTAWYEQAMLYRQERLGDWTVPLNKLVRDLDVRFPTANQQRSRPYRPD